MKAYLCLTLLTLFACGGATENSNNLADANRDISVTKHEWSAKESLIVKGELAEAPTFTLTNNSKSVTYKRIDLDVYYYNKDGKKIDSTSVRVPSSLQPGKSAEVNFVGTTNVSTSAKTAEAVVRAATKE